MKKKLEFALFVAISAVTSVMDSIGRMRERFEEIEQEEMFVAAAKKHNWR